MRTSPFSARRFTSAGSTRGASAGPAAAARPALPATRAIDASTASAAGHLRTGDWVMVSSSGGGPPYGQEYQLCYSHPMLPARPRKVILLGSGRTYRLGAFAAA